jgi:hypothetical protein
MQVSWPNENVHKVMCFHFIPIVDHKLPGKKLLMITHDSQV